MSEPTHLLRIDRLRLKNFRCFAACEVNLHPTLTILVAENAQGKTALLDALRLALQEFVTTVDRGKQPRGFERSDVHLKRGVQDEMESQLPTEFQVDGQVDGEPVSWSRVLGKDSFHARTSTKGTKHVRRVATRLADRSDANNGDPSDDQPTVLPVVAYYGTGRLYDEHRLTEGKRWLAEASSVRVSAYLDCLSPSSSYKSFSAWFGQKWDQVSDPRFRAVGFDARPENHITAVRDAVSTVLEPTGWTTIVWEPASQDDDGRTYRPGYIALEHSHKGRLPLTHLSDGVRNMVALVGDLAHRCVRLNPFFGEHAAKKTPGIVLIDELEMHLHPLWQQLILATLQTAFPHVQFVGTTHSPQVVTTVRSECLRILKDGNIFAAPAGTDGAEAQRILESVFQVSTRPDTEMARMLDKYLRMIDLRKWETPEALALRARLDKWSQGQEPRLLDADLQIENIKWEEGK